MGADDPGSGPRLPQRPQRVDVAAKLPRSSVVGEPSRAGVTAATILPHLETGGISNDGAETMEQRQWSTDDGAQEDGVQDDGEWEGANLLNFSLKPTIFGPENSTYLL